MRKKILLLNFFCFVSFVLLFAQKSQFSGVFLNQKPSKVALSFFKYGTLVGDEEMYYTVPVESDGYFNINIDIESPKKITFLFDSVSFQSYIDMSDSVFISIENIQGKNAYYFSGSNVSANNYLQEESYYEKILDTLNPTVLGVQLFDSISNQWQLFYKRYNSQYLLPDGFQAIISSNLYFSVLLWKLNHDFDLKNMPLTTELESKFNKESTSCVQFFRNYLDYKTKAKKNGLTTGQLIASVSKTFSSSAVIELLKARLLLEGIQKGEKNQLTSAYTNFTEFFPSSIFIPVLKQYFN